MTWKLQLVITAPCTYSNHLSTWHIIHNKHTMFVSTHTHTNHHQLAEVPPRKPKVADKKVELVMKKFFLQSLGCLRRQLKPNYSTVCKTQTDLLDVS